MKLFSVYLLYYIGDIISRTTMQWFNGFGYSLYSKVMMWSVDLDTEHKVWKSVKSRKKKK